MAFTTREGRTQTALAEINMIPFIDIVLVLLIIFMVLVPSMLKHLTATIPKKADESTPQPPGESIIVVEYTANRELSLSDEPVAPDQLAAKLAEIEGQAQPRHALQLRHDGGHPRRELGEPSARRKRCQDESSRSHQVRAGLARRPPRPT